MEAMGSDPQHRQDRNSRRSDRPQGSGGIVFALVALALILAIGFFYLTNESREDRRADAITQAADSVDNGARIVGEAARNAADKLRNNN
jgi:hypothetical protein